jgi:hypothetical protein
MAIDQSDAMEQARLAAERGFGSRVLEELAERVGARASVQAVFGEPIQRGDLTIVPVARVRWGVGGGAGSGGDATGGPGFGSGIGGGGGVTADPIGYLEIRPSGSEFRPITYGYPNPLFLLAAGLAASMVLRALARLVRR